MAKDVRLPKLDAAMQEGIIIAWLKAEGDQVTAGEPLYQVETAKAVTEIESPATGRLVRIVHPQGNTVPVGTVIASIE